MSIYVIGIDPGQNGGIAALNNGHLIDLTPMPRNARGFYEHLCFLGYPDVIKRSECHIFIENVHSMPTDGVHSAFVFGQGLGRLEGVIAATSFPEALKLQPKAWMAYFNLNRNKEENESKYDYKKRIKQKALDLIETKFRTQVTLKTCDAFLIALYGYKSLQNADLRQGYATSKETAVLE